MNMNCGVGIRVFLTVRTMAIRSNTVDSFEEKMPSKVKIRLLVGRCHRMEPSTPRKQHNPISLIRNVYYKNKTQFNKTNQHNTSQHNHITT